MGLLDSRCGRVKRKHQTERGAISHENVLNVSHLALLSVTMGVLQEQLGTAAVPGPTASTMLVCSEWGCSSSLTLE